jgi:hypothetical protein
MQKTRSRFNRDSPKRRNLSDTRDARFGESLLLFWSRAGFSAAADNPAKALGAARARRLALLRRARLFSPRASAARVHAARPTQTALYRLVADQRTTFAQVTAEQGHVPSFVNESFERFLRCGVPACGFARYQCTSCQLDHLVPLSCKAGSGLNLTPHYHLIGLDGWFHHDAAGQLAFTRAPTPAQEEVEALLLDVHERVLRVLSRRGLLEADTDDALARDAPALSACYEGAVTQRVGLGPNRGRPVLKLGTSLAQHLASAYERVEGAGWLCARLDGFDLHGRVAFGAPPVAPARDAAPFWDTVEAEI